MGEGGRLVPEEGVWGPEELFLSIKPLSIYKILNSQVIVAEGEVVAVKLRLEVGEEEEGVWVAQGEPRAVTVLEMEALEAVVAD